MAPAQGKIELIHFALSSGPSRNVQPPSGRAVYMTPCAALFTPYLHTTSRLLSFAASSISLYTFDFLSFDPFG